jgi:hypothetical protein
MGRELVRVHDAVRAELRALQDAAPAGELPERDRRPLLAQWAAFCSALTGEDAHVLPALAEQFPDLAPIVAKPAEDHQLIGMVIGRIEAAAGTPRLAGAVRHRSGVLNFLQPGG